MSTHRLIDWQAEVLPQHRPEQAEALRLRAAMQAELARARRRWERVAQVAFFLAILAGLTAAACWPLR